MYFVLPRMMNATFVYLCIFLSIFGGARAAAQSQTVKLAWGQIPGAVSYEIQITPTDAAEKVLAFKSVTTPEAALELPPGHFVYRVRADAADGTAGPWSEPQSFDVKAVAIEPTAPKANVTVLRHTAVRFSWRAPLGGDFKIEIVDDKGYTFERNTKDTKFLWRPKKVGSYRWRVAYAANEKETWTDFIPISVSDIINTLNSKIWIKDVWAGVFYSHYNGTFPEVSNQAKASTLSVNVSAIIERHFEITPRFMLPISIAPELRYQSVVKRAEALPGAAVGIAPLFKISDSQFGFYASLGERKVAAFEVSSDGQYSYGSFYRNEILYGVHGVFVAGEKMVIKPYVGAGVDTGGHSDLGFSPKSSPVFEAGLTLRPSFNSKWQSRLRYRYESVDWSADAGNGSLISNNVVLDVGAEL